MLFKLELVPGLVFGFELMFADELNPLRGFFAHIGIIRIICLWGFEEMEDGDNE